MDEDPGSIDDTMKEALAGINSGASGTSTDGSSVAPTSPPAGGSTPEPWRAPPKSWKSDYHPQWSKFDPQVMQYVHQREKEALDGITKYKTVSDKWDSTVQPFKQWFDHYKVDPHDAFNRLARAHIVMKWGNPDNKKAYAQQLLNDYDLYDALGLQKPAAGGAAGNQVASPELEQLRNQVTHLATAAQEREYKENLTKVQTFFADPKNKYANDLQNDILKIIQRHQAAGEDVSLDQAYEEAMWLNPETRMKLSAEQIEASAQPQKPGPTNIKPSSAPANPTDDGGKDESLDETLRSTLKLINKRRA